MSTAKACGYVSFFSGSKFPLCITDSIFGLVLFFFGSTYNYLGGKTNLMLQAFAKPDLALARKYQVQHLPCPRQAQPFLLWLYCRCFPCGFVIHTMS